MALTESLSGIRGIWGKDLNREIAARYAYSYLSFLKSKAKSPVIVIGRDTRQSGSLIMDAAAEVLDCEIIDVGIAPTPAVELAVREFNADGGIIITASHNEPCYNGFKFLRDDGAVLSEKDMGEVIRLFHKAKGIKIKVSAKRGMENKSNELVKKYNDFVVNFIGKGNIAKIRASKLKIVVDPNGGAGTAALAILKNIGADVVPVNSEQGVFSRAVEPNEESLFYLTNSIKEHNADFAAGFDCDADRAEIMLPSGQIVSGHYVLALAAKYIFSCNKGKFTNKLKNNGKNKIVVVNDATSNLVKEIVESYNGKIVETGVGEISVVDEMLRQNAVLGGEGSSAGAIMPPSRCRDGILTIACIVSLAANEGKNLSKIIGSMPKYYTLREKRQFEQKHYEKIANSIEIYYSNKNYKIKSLNDSIKAVADKSSFVWFRASKTESGVFRIIADSDNKEKSEELMKEAVEVFENAAGANSMGLWRK